VAISDGMLWIFNFFEYVFMMSYHNDIQNLGQSISEFQTAFDNLFSPEFQTV